VSTTLDAVPSRRQTQGNDLTIGRAFGSLLEAAGLSVEAFRSGGLVRKAPTGLRGPAWAAREALVSAGFATTEDIARWDAAFQRADTLPTTRWVSAALIVAVGRAPG